MMLEENWREGLALDDGPWDDFPFLASEELWRRLTPDLPCPELIADRLEKHIRSTDGRPHVATYDQQLSAAVERRGFPAVWGVVEVLILLAHQRWMWFSPLA